MFSICILCSLVLINLFYTIFWLLIEAVYWPMCCCHDAAQWPLLCVLGGTCNGGMFQSNFSVGQVLWSAIDLAQPAAVTVNTHVPWCFYCFRSHPILWHQTCEHFQKTEISSNSLNKYINWYCYQFHCNKTDIFYVFTDILRRRNTPSCLKICILYHQFQFSVYICTNMFAESTYLFLFPVKLTLWRHFTS